MVDRKQVGATAIVPGRGGMGQGATPTMVHLSEVSLYTNPVRVQEVLEVPVKKLNRHVVIALKHMHARRAALLEKRAWLTKEIEELDAAILALE